MNCFRLQLDKAGTILKSVNAIILFCIALPLTAQSSCEVPAAPVLTFVSINESNGNTELNWIKSPSTEIAAYIIYNHTNGFGIPIDTVWDPDATTYSFYSGPAIKYFSESYCIAAFRMPICASALSNVVSTVFCTSTLDTCQKKLEVKWNKYSNYPYKVTGYEIKIMKDGSYQGEAHLVGPDMDHYVMPEFEADVQYCFSIKVNLENSLIPVSNTSCLYTEMQRPPAWINADFATIENNNILLSFTVDPATEFNKFIVEKRKGYSGTFEKKSQLSKTGDKVNFTDSDPDKTNINFYRLSAINNCNNPVVYSNLASNIVLDLKQNSTEILLTWNKYRNWSGTIDRYEIYAGTATESEVIKTISSNDTTTIIPYSDLMYRTTGDEICFSVKAYESGNPHGTNGSSLSGNKCIPPTEVITVPNLFTPDNDLINDLFKPVLSFTPGSYRLVITDLNRRIVFETDDPLMEWDGTTSGKQLPDGVYLWQLKLIAPSGKSISQSGTVTIVRLH